MEIIHADFNFDYADKIIEISPEMERVITHEELYQFIWREEIILDVKYNIKKIMEILNG
jgi:hypothetical protein